MKEHRMSSIMRHYRAQKTPEILLNTQRCQSSSEKFCQQRPKIKQKFALKIEFREGDSYSHFLQKEREKEPWKQHQRGTRQGTDLILGIKTAYGFIFSSVGHFIIKSADITKCSNYFATKCVRCFVTKCGNFINKCDSYYKMSQFYYKYYKFYYNFIT